MKRLLCLTLKIKTRRNVFTGNRVPCTVRTSSVPSTLRMIPTSVLDDTHTRSLETTQENVSTERLESVVTVVRFFRLCWVVLFVPVELTTSPSSRTWTCESSRRTNENSTQETESKNRTKGSFSGGEYMVHVQVQFPGVTTVLRVFPNPSTSQQHRRGTKDPPHKTRLSQPDVPTVLEPSVHPLFPRYHRFWSNLLLPNLGRSDWEDKDSNKKNPFNG